MLSGFNKNSQIGDPIFIIAEIGINHNGDLEQARTLMKIAKDSGCPISFNIAFRPQAICLYSS